MSQSDKRGEVLPELERVLKELDECHYKYDSHVRNEFSREFMDLCWTYQDEIIAALRSTPSSTRLKGVPSMEDLADGWSSWDAEERAERAVEKGRDVERFYKGEHVALSDALLDNLYTDAFHDCDGSPVQQHLAGLQAVNAARSAIVRKLGPDTCDSPSGAIINMKLDGSGEWYCHGCGASHLEPRCKFRKSAPYNPQGAWQPSPYGLCPKCGIARAQPMPECAQDGCPILGTSDDGAEKA